MHIILVLIHCNQAGVTNIPNTGTQLLISATVKQYWSELQGEVIREQILLQLDIPF